MNYYPKKSYITYPEMINFLEIPASEYQLASRTKLVQLADDKIGICLIRKSWIIQKDALRIIEMASSILNTAPGVSVSLVCTPNICSKSIQLLQSKSIGIVYI